MANKKKLIRRPTENVYYGTWIRTKKVASFLSIAIFCSIIPILINLPIIVDISLYFISLVFLYIFFILIRIQVAFSDRGGKYQEKIHKLILSKRIDSDSYILDIGAGSGALGIALAKSDKSLKVIGVDLWEPTWEYSKKMCEYNATLEGVSDKVTFTEGSAAQLPFKDNSFDTVISCLTFHEVKQLTNKNQAIYEAIRVLKPEGKFIFLDLFEDTRYFSNINKQVNSMSLTSIKFELVSEAIELPNYLLTKNTLKNAVLITGYKEK